MRGVTGWAAAAAMALLSGCGPEFVQSGSLTRGEMMARASHVLVGVIEAHEIEAWPAYRMKLRPDLVDQRYWRVLRRRVRVETLIRGKEARKAIDVFEIFWTGGTSGNWNSTRDGERALFLLRMQEGRYRMVQDWERSIFPVVSGHHERLPLNEARPMWERVALLNYWFEAGEPDRSNGRLHFYGSDPGGELSGWRKVKLQRGLVRHPSSQVRVAACRELVHTGWGQDECWEQLTEEERRHIRDGGWRCCTAAQVAAMRRQMAEVDARVHWRARDRDERRILTAVSDRRMRVEFCRMYEAAYPGDKDTGCPAWLAPPATRVTEAGDVPLRGAWPR